MLHILFLNLCYRPKRRGNDAVSASAVNAKTIAVIALRVETTNLIKYASKDAVKSSPRKR